MRTIRTTIAGIVVLVFAAGCSDDQAQQPTSPGRDDAAGPSSSAPDPQPSFASLSGDVEAGRRAFSQCRSCHAIEAGVNRVGPSLHGVVDRRAAEVPDYKYSDAMRSSGQVWSAESLYTFLEAPRTAVPGTKMTFAGVRNAQSRADIVAYLSTLR